MNKQIEEMARIICKPTANRGECEKCGFKKQCSKFDDAKDLYNAGYRKASDVAREIFAEIEDVLNNIGYFDEIDFKALKKKYKSEGEKNGTDN